MSEAVPKPSTCAGIAVVPRARLVGGARAGGRRCDARPLLVRRREPHFAGSAGAGRACAAHRKTALAARRTSRATRRRWARRRVCCAWSAMTNRASASSNCSARAGSRAHLERDPELAHHDQAARAVASAATAARRLRELAGARSPARGLARFDDLLPQHDVILMSDYAKGGLTHVTQMIADAHARRQTGAGRSEGRRLGALSRRDADHAEPRGIARGGRALEVGRGPDRARGASCAPNSSSMRCC